MNTRQDCLLSAGDSS